VMEEIGQCLIGSFSFEILGHIHMLHESSLFMS
jgi:hypothetical protein